MSSFLHYWLNQVCTSWPCLFTLFSFLFINKKTFDKKIICTMYSICNVYITRNNVTQWYVCRQCRYATTTISSSSFLCYYILLCIFFTDSLKNKRQFWGKYQKRKISILLVSDIFSLGKMMMLLLKMMALWTPKNGEKLRGVIQGCSSFVLVVAVWWWWRTVCALWYDYMFFLSKKTEVYCIPQR